MDKESVKKMDFSKKIVSLVLFLNVTFTIVIFYLFLKVGSEPSTLIVSWFGFTGVELFSLSKITRDKINQKEYEPESNQQGPPV